MQLLKDGNFSVQIRVLVHTVCPTSQATQTCQASSLLAQRVCVETQPPESSRGKFKRVEKSIVSHPSKLSRVMGQQELLHYISGKLFSLTMCDTENHTAWAHCQLPCPRVERHLYDSSSNTHIAPDHIPSCFHNSTFSCEEKDWECDFQWKMINLLYTGTQTGDFSVALSILKFVCKRYIWNNYTKIKMFLDNSKIPFTIMLSQSLQRLPNHITMKTVL